MLLNCTNPKFHHQLSAHINRLLRASIFALRWRWVRWGTARIRRRWPEDIQAGQDGTTASIVDSRDSIVDRVWICGVRNDRIQVVDDAGLEDPHQC